MQSIKAVFFKPDPAEQVCSSGLDYFGELMNSRNENATLSFARMSVLWIET